jgi:hypothetical protein
VVFIWATVNYYVGVWVSSPDVLQLMVIIKPKTHK